MKNGLQLGAKASLLAMFLLVFANLSNAISLAPESTDINSCICETNLVKIIASNPSDKLLSVVMSADGDKEWLIPGPKEYNLLPRSTKEVTAFVTPDCFAIPGKYEVGVTASSSAGSASTRIGVDVSACVHLPEKKTISLCRGETATSTIDVKNIARDEERIYRMSIIPTEIDKSAIAITPKVTVDVNSERAVEFSIDSSKLDIGAYNFEIMAQALYEATDVPTTDVDTSSIEVEVKNCEAFDFIAPDSIEVCAGVPSSYPVKLINRGAPTEITFISDSDMVSFSPTEGMLHSGETANADINVNAPEGEYTVMLKAKSDLKFVEQQIKIDSRECFGVQMDLALKTGEVVCSEFGGEFYLAIKNRETAADYSLAISGVNAALSENEVSLKELETRKVKLSIPKDAETGTYTAIISAESVDSTDSISKEFSIQKCHDFRLTGPEIEACPCETATLEYELINFGTKDDEFDLKSGSSFLVLDEKSAAVKSKEKVLLRATINTCNLESGEVNAIITAKSRTYPSLEDKLQVDLNVRSKEQCFGIELKPASNNIHSKCEIKSQSVQVINKGSKETAVSLSATAGSKVTPDNLLLDSGESKEVFLVIFPSPSRCGTQFPVEMKAESKGVVVTEQFAIDMEPEEEAAPTAAPASPTPATPITGEQNISAIINYTDNNTLLIETLSGVEVNIEKDGEQVTKKSTDEEGKFEETLGPGTFLLTLSKAGYKTAVIEVKVPEAEGTGAAGGLGTIPLLLIAFLIIVAALYFVLRRGESDEEGEEEFDEEPEERKPKRRGRKRRG